MRQVRKDAFQRTSLLTTIRSCAGMTQDSWSSGSQLATNQSRTPTQRMRAEPFGLETRLMNAPTEGEPSSKSMVTGSPCAPRLTLATVGTLITPFL